MRDSSPPEAISRSGAAGTPGLGAIMNSTASLPVGPSSRLPSRTSKPASGMARAASCSRTACGESRGNGLAGPAQRCGEPHERRPLLGELGLELGDRPEAGAQLRQPLPSPGAVLEYGGHAPPVLADQAVELTSSRSRTPSSDCASSSPSSSS